MVRLLVFTSALVAALAVPVPARPALRQQDGMPTLGAPQKPQDFGSPTEEMLRRAEIKHEEESHEEMVARSDEAAQIGEEILSSFNKNRSLTSEDYKKLERLEKLARKIRGSAGGSDDEEALQDPPGMIDAAVERLAKISGALKKSVAKTSRLVISAAVIQTSNEVIELIRHIRNKKRP